MKTATADKLTLAAVAIKHRNVIIIQYIIITFLCNQDLTVSLWSPSVSSKKLSGARYPGSKMGEQTITPNENGNGFSSDDPDNNSEVEINNSDIDNDIVEDMTPEEIANLDSQLEALNSALDDIEQKNDDIHAKLVQLLHANREVREELKFEKPENSEMETDADTPKQ
ncbi:hypothetical protein JTB14_000575 [Gonioctena quinquepunctata]|nr:hypothetical protein JTB14_000575 [Gonioctena quinquepunctata]